MIGKTTKGKSFGGTVKYVLGKADAQLIYTNVFAGLGAETSAEAIAAEMTQTALRHRTDQPVYHLSVSPAETDRLSVQDWVNFSQDLLQELGLKNHQVVVVLHNDEDYPSGQPRPHAHFVVNLVNEAGKRASTSWDYRRTEQALRHLEKCYELTPVLSSWEQHNTVIVQQSLTLETTAELPVAAPAVKERSLFVKANYVQSAEEQMQETDANNQPRSPDAQLLNQENSSFQSYRDYRDIFAATARQPAESEQTALRSGTIAGRELEQFGQVLQRYGDREVDGTQLAGAGLSVLGNAVKIGDAIAAEIARARERHQSQRFNNLLDQLEAVGERTAKLEAEIETNFVEPEQVIAAGGEDFVRSVESAEFQADPERITRVIDGLETVAERAQQLEIVTNDLVENSSTTREASLTSTASPERSTPETETIPDFWAEAEPENTVPDIPEISEQSTATAANEAVSNRQVDRVSAEDSLANATELIGEQINQIEELLDSKDDSEFVPIKIDRQASFNQQLEQIEAAINYLNSRLDRLEEVVEAMQEQQLGTSEVSEVAQTLADYANARGEVYGIDPELPIQTRSMGTIEVADGGNYIVIQDQQDIKFEAVKLDGEWEVTANELSDNETQKLASLPRTAKAYQAHIDGRELVGFLQRKSPAPEQLSANQSHNIQWQGKDEAKDKEFSYSFSIAQSADGVQVVRGVDQNNQAEVFSAIVQADGAVLTSKSEIPSARIDSLLQQEEQQTKAEQQQQQKQRARSAESELTQ